MTLLQTTKIKKPKKIWSIKHSPLFMTWDQPIIKRDINIARKAMNRITWSIPVTSTETVHGVHQAPSISSFPVSISSRQYKAFSSCSNCICLSFAAISSSVKEIILYCENTTEVKTRPRILLRLWAFHGGSLFILWRVVLVNYPTAIFSEKGVSH